MSLKPTEFPLTCMWADGPLSMAWFYHPAVTGMSDPVASHG